MEYKINLLGINKWWCILTVLPIINLMGLLLADINMLYFSYMFIDLLYKTVTAIRTLVYLGAPWLTHSLSQGQEGNTHQSLIPPSLWHESGQEEHLLEFLNNLWGLGTE